MSNSPLADLPVADRMKMLRAALAPLQAQALAHAAAVAAAAAAAEPATATARPAATAPDGAPGGAPCGATAALIERMDRLARQLAGASQKAQVREMPFVSNVRFFGPLIVRFRYLWNWMSTKWWVLPMLQQQNRFNLEVVSLLQETVSAARLSVQTLSERDAAHQAELRQLRDELGRLQVAAGRPNHASGQSTS